MAFHLLPIKIINCFDVYVGYNLYNDNKEYASMRPASI